MKNGMRMIRDMLMNAKALNVLYCGLNTDEFNRIDTCKNAEEIRDTLEVTHEGTN